LVIRFGSTLSFRTKHESVDEYNGSLPLNPHYDATLSVTAGEHRKPLVSAAYHSVELTA